MIAALLAIIMIQLLTMRECRPVVSFLTDQESELGQTTTTLEGSDYGKKLQVASSSDEK